jgi:hypothetical protein
MPKRNPKIEVPAPFKVLQPFYLEDHLPKLGNHVGECKCWYCDVVLIKDGIRFANPSSIQLLLSGDFAHRSCQDQVKTPGYAKARASYNAQCNRNLERHMKYAKTHPVKLTVTKVPFSSLKSIKHAK